MWESMLIRSRRNARWSCESKKLCRNRLISRCFTFPRFPKDPSRLAWAKETSTVCGSVSPLLGNGYWDVLRTPRARLGPARNLTVRFQDGGGDHLKLEQLLFDPLKNAEIMCSAHVCFCSSSSFCFFWGDWLISPEIGFRGIGAAICMV